MDLKEIEKDLEYILGCIVECFAYNPNIPTESFNNLNTKVAELRSKILKDLSL